MENESNDENENAKLNKKNLEISDNAVREQKSLIFELIYMTINNLNMVHLFKQIILVSCFV